MRSTALLLALATCDPAPPSPQPETTREDARALVDALRGAEPGITEYVEADALGPGHAGRRLQVHGFVRPGSILKNGQTGAIRFAIGARDPGVVVEFTGVLPDRFQEKLEVVVTGTLSADGKTLAGDELVAKCPSSYDEAGRPSP
jgi:hypothetical protein